MALDYSRKYDPTQVDAPENRKGMVHLLEKYGKDLKSGEKFVYTDQDGKVDLTVSIYLRVLADYASQPRNNTQSLEAALKLREQNPMSVECMMTVCNRLRYNKLFYESADDKGAKIESCDISGDYGPEKALALFTSVKQMRDEAADRKHVHQATVSSFLKACEAGGIKHIIINPYSTTLAYNLKDIRTFIGYCDLVDTFWKNVRVSGVEGEDLFPLLAQDFTYKIIACQYSGVKTVTGIASPYTDGQAPGYNILTPNGRTVYVPLSEIVEICEPADEKQQQILAGILSHGLRI
ncbi:MAG: SseB family protein [Clostridia bacterium]|nr:SseB family protein [Clostridia bacterium]